MLLAEIHGKTCPEVEGLEDMITSAVFGHLRLVDPPQFWLALFERARTIENPSRTLAEALRNSGTDPEHYSRIQMSFWKNLSGQEPDLVITFTGVGVDTLRVLIEVKLNSGKSGSGENDQLAKYLELLDAAHDQEAANAATEKRYLVYLTRRFAASDLADSVKVSKVDEAKSRMFGLEWNDVLEIADASRNENFLLAEVADFLRRREFERFAGFRDSLCGAHVPNGVFYSRSYFSELVEVRSNIEGNFYGR